MSEKDPVKRARRGSGAITLREVALLAGVAPITASRAINTPEQVSPQVRQKVDEAVARTGYVPNRIAGGLASARSRLIAAVVPNTVYSVFMETIEALNRTLFEAGYQLMLGETGYSPEREEALLEAIIGRRPDGIYLTGILPPGRGRDRLLASGIPVVETWDLTPEPIDMAIGFSHADIGSTVAAYLLAKGHRRFALVRGADDRAARRAAAFQAVVSAHEGAAVFELAVVGQRTLRNGRDAMSRIQVEAPGTTAIFCSSDLLALGVMTEARMRGLAVPQDVAVMGFGDVPFVSDMAPALTTVRINGAEIGEQAARRLIDRAEGRPVPARIVDVGFTIVERDSA